MWPAAAPGLRNKILQAMLAHSRSGRKGDGCQQAAKPLQLKGRAARCVRPRFASRQRYVGCFAASSHDLPLRVGAWAASPTPIPTPITPQASCWGEAIARAREQGSRRCKH